MIGLLLAASVSLTPAKTEALTGFAYAVGACKTMIGEYGMDRIRQFIDAQPTDVATLMYVTIDHAQTEVMAKAERGEIRLLRDDCEAALAKAYGRVEAAK